MEGVGQAGRGALASRSRLLSPPVCTNTRAALWALHVSLRSPHRRLGAGCCCRSVERHPAGRPPRYLVHSSAVGGRWRPRATQSHEAKCCRQSSAVDGLNAPMHIQDSTRQFGPIRLLVAFAAVIARSAPRN